MKKHLDILESEVKKLKQLENNPVEVYITTFEWAL